MSRSVGLLISMLVRYPELGTVRLDPACQTLKFTFLVTRLLEEEDFTSLKDHIRSALDAYTYLMDKPIETADVARESYDDLTVLTVTRDVQSLSQEEISLLIEILRSRFKRHLVADFNESLLEEDLLMQEQIIGEMLEDLRDTVQEKNLIAFREGGRVLVFNK
jgi:hypothetical protein